MRKYFVGALIGFALSLAAGAHAEVGSAIQSLIGKPVEGTFPVTVQDKKLDKDAIVIEGSTYLPVRSFGESIGYEVTFDSELGVKLTKKTVGDTVYQPTSSLTGSSTDVQTNPVTMQKYTPQQLDFKIEQRKIDIQALKMGIESGGSSDPNVAEFKTRLAKYEAELAGLERQKAALQQ